MELLKFDDMKKTWHQIARYHDGTSDPSFELEVHKKLLNIFQVGDFYYYIVNIARVEIEFTSESVKSILGMQDTREFDMPYVFENVHPDDKARFIAHEQQVTSFFNALPPEKVLKYKVSYDYRIRKKDGSYIWVLMQTVTIQSNEQGAVIRVLGVQTDITHLKTDNKPSGLSFIGLEGEPSYYNVNLSSPVLIAQEFLTRREKEILKMIVEGVSSKAIAQKLHISIHTVNSHRKNILAKTGCSTPLELITKTIREGWV
jgi:DNA-binding CsgD family transcriptional regulator